MNLKDTLLTILVGLIFIFADNAYAQPYPTQCVHAKGMASLVGVSKEYARHMALRDALRNASMQNNLSISSTQQTDNYQLTKSTARFTTRSKIKKYSITYEGKKKLTFDEHFDKQGNEIKNADKLAAKTYEVEVDACLTEDPKVCTKKLGNQYQVRLAIAQVAIDPNQAQSVADISNFLPGYQMELQRRLEQIGYKNQVLLQTGSEVLPNQALTPNLSPDILDPIQNKTGAQYLLLTVIRSVASTYQGDQTWNNIKHFYNQDVTPNARHIEADWYLVDLLNHNIAFQQRGGFDVKGEVAVGRNKPFGSSAFFSTNTGMVFSALLQNQAQSVMTDLHCASLETEIIGVRGKDYIVYLSKNSGAKVGDTLSVYHKFGASVLYQGVNLGTDDKPAGFLKIKRLQQNFAIAELKGSTDLIQMGDIVKSW